MKIEYKIDKISGKDKSLCIGDLIKYYGETKYKLMEGLQKLNDSKTTKGMVANLLRKVSNNPTVDLIINNMEAVAKKNIFFFTVDEQNLLLFDDGVDKCNLVVFMGDEYFAAKAVYDMMKPGFRRLEYQQYVDKEKEDWVRWFEKNLNEYTHSYTKKMLEA